MDEEIPFESIHLGTIDSTIPYSNKMIDDGKKENFLLNCDEQTQGRGSTGRKWVSQKGNAYSTLNLKEEYIPQDIVKLLPFLVSISVCEFLNKCSKNSKFMIKWPNDVLCSDKLKTFFN